MQINRPKPGVTYYAPISLACLWPLVFGEYAGIVVDQPSQTVGVVYSTREAAEAAFADPTVWGDGNRKHARIAALTYRGTIMRGRGGFAFATEAEMVAHDQAATR